MKSAERGEIVEGEELRSRLLERRCPFAKGELRCVEPLGHGGVHAARGEDGKIDKRWR